MLGQSDQTDATVSATHVRLHQLVEVLVGAPLYTRGRGRIVDLRGPADTANETFGIENRPAELYWLRRKALRDRSRPSAGAG